MSSVVIAGDTSGSVTLQAPAVAGSTVITLPATSGTLSTSGGFSNLVVFQTSGSWTVPSGITKCKVTVIGGGAGGGGTGSAGGGAGGCAIKICTVTPGASVTITIGAGGATGSSGAVTGGTSSFGAFCSATGGSNPVSNTKTGLGGLGVSGDINMRGGPSYVDYANGTTSGGNSFFVGGGGVDDPTPQTGIMGGGGSRSRLGGDGIIVIEY